MILFNKPPHTGNENQYVIDAMTSTHMSGGGPYSKKCQGWFEEKLGCIKALLTPNCTQALEMAAILIDIQPGDEVIMPSYTFVSTANAFVLRGAKIIFVDIRPDTMNIDEKCIEQAITEKTKAIVPVHYAGVACEMDVIMDIANHHGLYVIEDAAQGMMSIYKGKPLGTIGHFGAYSFHETKNYTSGGEGGLLIINDEKFVERAEIIREKGTDRSKFIKGQVDKYSWVDTGSSFLPSELQAAYLFSQLEEAELINENRLNAWNIYYEALTELSENNKLTLPCIPNECKHNAHMFYIKLTTEVERNRLISHLKENGISSVFHYIPLHSSLAGEKFGSFNGDDNITTFDSQRLLRLPMYYGIGLEDIKKVTESIIDFFNTLNVIR